MTNKNQTEQKTPAKASGISESAKKALAKVRNAGGTMANLKTTDVSSLIELYGPQIKRSIPKHLTAERMIQQVTTLISRTPDLAQCSLESIIGATMQASILGFQPVSALGQCYFIPFNNKITKKKEAQFIIGYKGYIDLARRSGELKTIYAQAVYKNDLFEFEYGLEPKLRHIPAEGDRGEPTHFYAVAKFVNGGDAFEVMTLSDVMKVKKRSASANSSKSPWNHPEDWIEMAKKTVIRRLSKWLPLSVEYQSAVSTDGAVIGIDNFGNQGEIDLDNLERPDLEQIEETEAEVIDQETGEVKEKGKTGNILS